MRANQSRRGVFSHPGIASAPVTMYVLVPTAAHAQPNAQSECQFRIHAKPDTRPLKLQ